VPQMKSKQQDVTIDMTKIQTQRLFFDEKAKSSYTEPVCSWKT